MVQPVDSIWFSINPTQPGADLTVLDGRKELLATPSVPHNAARYWTRSGTGPTGDNSYVGVSHEHMTRPSIGIPVSAIAVLQKVRSDGTHLRKRWFK